MAIDRDSETNKRIGQLLETVFLALAGIYLAHSLLEVTTLKLAWPKGLMPLLLWGMAAVALLRLGTGKLLRAETLLGAALAVNYLLVYRSDRYDFLLYLAILTVGFIDIDYRKILKTYLLTAGVAYCVAVFAGLLGVITNYVFIKNGLRSSWGIAYPTDFASMGLFLLLMLWVVWRKLPDWAMLLVSAGYTLAALFIARSSTSTVCGALFACAVLYRMFEAGVASRRPRLRWLGKGADLFATAAFPVLALVMFGMMLAYARGMNVGYRLNNLLSNRLKYSVEAWRLHGVKAFGTPLEQNGGGFSTFPSNNYNFVDSTYPLILLRYGWVLLATLCLAWCRTARKAIRCGDRRLVLAMGIIAVHAFAEHHFIECHFNILAVMPLAAYLPARENRTENSEEGGAQGAAEAGRGEGGGDEGRARTRAAVFANVLTALLVLAVLYVAAPAALSWIKTALEIKRLGHGEHSLRLFCLLLGLLCGACAAAWAVSRILRTLIGRAPWQTCRTAIAALAACAVACAGGFWYANRTINAAIPENAAAVEADREALEIAVGAATGKVYSGVLPEVYHRSVAGMSYAALFEDDLARLRGDTTLMDAGEERGTFFDSGCLYVQISEAHALYTGDRAVIEALAEAGYRVTGYYSNTREVELERAARRNRVAYDEARGLVLEGSEALSNGPYYDLYGGRYTVTYELSLPEGETLENDAGGGDVCVLSVTSYRGENVLLEKEVAASDFDTSGRARISIPFSIGDSRSVSFGAQTAEGRRVNVEGIRYVKTPDYDVHTFYDARLRPVRVEYYDLEGKPAGQSGGFYSYDQEYDGYGNVALRRFYDGNGDLTLRSDGYAEVRWEHNAKKQVTRESFYDTQGAPVMISSRQAANEREYDADGNVTVWRYYDTAGRPVVTTAGYAELHRTFNGDRQIVREEYLGTDGAPLAQSTGFSAFEQEFDAAGNVTRRFYDGNGPVLRTDGYAEVRWQYNGLRQVTREEFYGTDGEPIVISSGYAADEREYDAAGNATVWRYYDADGAATTISSGYAQLRRTFNDRRQIVREEYLGTDGQPMLLPGGYAAVEREYNEYGSIKTQRHYGVENEPVLISDGYFEVRREYDVWGHVTEERYYDTGEAPTPCAKGYAILRRAYNDRDELTEERFLDAEGNPATIGAGYAQITYEYTEDRQLYLTHYLDGAGNPVQAGSGYLHEYLRGLLDRDLTILIAAKDEATGALTVALYEDLAALGIRTDLHGRYRNSFYAVIAPEGVTEEVGSQTSLSHEGKIDGVPYAITSAGYQVGNDSSIVIDGVEYSVNRRGMNIVVYDNAARKVIDAVSFDTCVQEMSVAHQ